LDTNQGRLDWLKQIPGITLSDYVKDTAEVCLFCRLRVLFFTALISIPRAITEIFKRADVEFYTFWGKTSGAAAFRF